MTSPENPMPKIMGILNVTPDSFSEGGGLSSTAAIDHAYRMVEEGASIIDIGGESSRPGAEPVLLEDELARVLPLVNVLNKENLPVKISVDTCKAEVMRQALDAGVDIINDILALQAPGALDTIARYDKAEIVLMHMQGRPRTMQTCPQYRDVVQEVSSFLQQRITACLEAGILRKNILIDPGFGFGKTLSHNLTLFKHLSKLKALGCRVLVGVSRKSMIGQLLDDRPVDGRLYGSVALALMAADKGASVVRVHDVAATNDALLLWQAVQ